MTHITCKHTFILVTTNLVLNVNIILIYVYALTNSIQYYNKNTTVLFLHVFLMLHVVLTVNVWSLLKKLVDSGVPIVGTIIVLLA